MPTSDAFLEAACIPAGELRERLLAFLVHEIRNPLATTLWSAEMLAREPSGSERLHRLASLSVRSTRRLRALLEDLFLLERMPASFPPGVVALDEAIARALGPHEQEPQGIAATVGEVPKGLKIALDPLAFDRLLHAVVRRSARVGPEGGLALRVAPPDDDRVALVVSKEGASAESLEPRLFSPGGAEGAGTTFAMLLARVLAHRLRVPIGVTEAAGPSVSVELSLPLVVSDG